MCGFSAVDGDMYFVSYRDPKLKETNAVYENIPEYLKNFTIDEKELLKRIIGTISTLDTPLTPQASGARSLSIYLAGQTYDDLVKERDEIINVTQEDIRALSDLIRAVLDQGYICVIGNETAVEESGELFNEVKNLM